MYLDNITCMSAEEIVSGFKAHGIGDKRMIADWLITLSQHWHIVRDNKVRGLIPKRPNLTFDEAMFTARCFDYVWDNIDSDGVPTEKHELRLKEGITTEKAEKMAKGKVGPGAPTGSGTTEPAVSSTAAPARSIDEVLASGKGVSVAQMVADQTISAGATNVTRAIHAKDDEHRRMSRHQKLTCNSYEHAPRVPAQTTNYKDKDMIYEKRRFEDGFMVCDKAEYGHCLLYTSPSPRD